MSVLTRPLRPRRVLIVGGVAEGAPCAARLRRLDESVEIAIFDRGRVWSVPRATTNTDCNPGISPAATRAYKALRAAGVTA